MAIYSCSISNVSRASGSSSCATLSYITASRCYDERTGKTYYGYGGEDRVKATGMLLPDHAPEAFKNAATCFSSLEKYEQKENARTAKKIILALPREVKEEEREKLVKDFAELFIKKGYPVAYAIHNDQDGLNPHAHLLIANRSIGKEGEWCASKVVTRFSLDQGGNRIPVLDKTTGLQKIGPRGKKQWKREKVQCNWLDEKESLQTIRDTWEKCCNRLLEPDQQITAKSYKDQGLENQGYIPTKHEGFAAREMAAKGIETKVITYNKEVKEHNSMLKKLLETIKKLRDEVMEHAREQSAAASARLADLLENIRTHEQGRSQHSTSRNGGTTSGSVQSVLGRKQQAEGTGKELATATLTDAEREAIAVLSADGERRRSEAEQKRQAGIKKEQKQLRKGKGGLEEEPGLSQESYGRSFGGPHM